MGYTPDCISQLLEMHAGLWAPLLSLLTCVGAGSRALFCLQSYQIDLPNVVKKMEALGFEPGKSSVLDSTSCAFYPL